MAKQAKRSHNEKPGASNASAEPATAPAVEMTALDVFAAASPRRGQPVARGTQRKQVAPAPWTDKYQHRVGSALSPQYITAVNRAADSGRMAAYADLLDELRAADPHLDGVLFKRCSRVAGARWEVAPQSNTRKRALAKEVAAFVELALQGIPSFNSHLLHLMGGVYHGRSALECVWKDSSEGFVVGEMHPVHARRVSFPAQNWEAHLYDETGTATSFTQWPGVPFSSYPAGKYVLHLPTLRNEYPTREGLGRVVQWYSLFKRWTMRDWMALAELAGRPGRVGYFGTGGANPEMRAGALPTASPAHINELEDALADWSGAAYAVLPDTVKVDFVNVAAGYSDLHEKLIKHLNAELSKAVLGGTLTTDAGERGARALGDTQQDEQLMIARWDARALSETITRQLVEPLVRYNFGDDAPVPRFTIDVSPDKDRAAFAQLVKSLADAGLNIPQSWVRDEANIPEPKPGEPILIPREPVEVDAVGVPVNTEPESAPGTEKVKRTEQPTSNASANNAPAKKGPKKP